MDDILTLPISSLVKKSAIDESSLPNSVLRRQQADRFIDMVRDISVLGRLIQVRRVNHNKGELNKLDLNTIVTEGAHSTSKPTTHTPTEDVVPYECVKYRSAFDLKRDFEEDNLQGADVRDLLVNMFTKRIAEDMDIAAIESDQSLDIGDAQTARNNLLGVNDGFHELFVDNVPAAQQIDAAGASASKDLYAKLIRQVPDRYQNELDRYKWFLPTIPFHAWYYDWSERATPGGDSALANGRAPGPWGIEMIRVPKMPTNLTFGSAGTDGHDIWLTPPENLMLVIQRDFTFEAERKPRTDLVEVTIHWRVDFAVQDTDMVVFAKNVSLSGSAYSL